MNKIVSTIKSLKKSKERSKKLKT